MPVPNRIFQVVLVIHGKTTRLPVCIETRPQVESTQGTSPRVAHSSGREPLSSSGSYCLTAGFKPICQWQKSLGSRLATRPNQYSAVRL